MPEQTAARRRGLVIGINRYPKIPNKNLHGCVNDAELIQALLTSKFGFDKADLRLMLDEEATRDSILDALEALHEATSDGDIVVLFYAGHGSRMPNPKNAGEFLEGLVTHDSGRVEHPNRDIFDLELFEWSRRMRAKTPNLTLIFDCCHSGNISRSLGEAGFGATTREVEPDTRDLGAMFGKEGPPPALRSRQLEPTDPDTTTAQRGRTGWLLDADRAAIVAACRADELAKEDKVPNDRGGKTRHGAMTHQLALALRPGATWREVFERAAPEVTRRFEDQHPQLEGQIDRVVFGTETRQPEPYLLVESVEADGRPVLGGGVAQGVVRGSIWGIYPAGTLTTHGEPRLTRVRITELGPVSCTAENTAAENTAAENTAAEEASTEPLATGQRAFLLDQPIVDPGLALVVSGDDREPVEQAIGGRALLRLVDDRQRADGVVERVRARDAVTPDDPFPGLGPLERDCWVAVGRDGCLLASAEPADRNPAAAALTALAENLEKEARFRGIRAIRNPDPASRFRDRLRTRVLRVDASTGEASPAEPEADFGLPMFRKGELADIELTNTSDRRLRLTLVQLGADRKIELMVPFRNDSDARGGLPLAPGQSVTVAQHLRRVLRRDHRTLPGLPMRLPEDFPWAADPSGASSEIGTLTILAFATEVEAHFQFLEQGASRHIGSHPLERIAAYFGEGPAAGDGGTRSLLGFVDELEEAPPDWTVVPIELGMRP